ncbi:MAG: helix-turn-helix transcriptional regulator [Bacteroidia bacterium]|nr:helix-turn-helix transcriptional regulator [Bacteroidia bacterium]
MKISREKIKMYRIKNDEKQSNIAQLLGISTGQYSNLENNPEKFTDEQLTNLADYLNTRKINLYEISTNDELLILFQNKRYFILIGLLISTKDASIFFLGKINDAICETIDKYFKTTTPQPDL